VNSNSQLTTKALDVPFRLAERTRATWVLPGLVMQETGAGEIKGTKYMKAATEFPGDASWPKSKWIVGPVASSLGGAPPGDAAWLNAGCELLVQSTIPSSSTIA